MSNYIAIYFQHSDFNIYRILGLVLLKSYLDKPEWQDAFDERKIFFFVGSLSLNACCDLLCEAVNYKQPCIMFTTFAIGSTGHNWQNFNMAIFFGQMLEFSGTSI